MLKSLIKEEKKGISILQTDTWGRAKTAQFFFFFFNVSVGSTGLVSLHLGDLEATKRVIVESSAGGDC